MTRSDPELLVIGEALVDVVRTAAGETYSSPGGSPANVAVGLARLGVDTALLTRLGRDAEATLISEHLDANGVEVLAAIDDEPTSTADADVDLHGNAGYAFRLHWSLPDDALSSVELDSLHCVHVGSIAAVQSPGADTVFRFVRELHPRATVSYDPNCRPSMMGDAADIRRRVEAMLRYADIVKASDEDLAFLYPDVDVTDSARWWVGLGPSLVVMTRGASGYQAWTDDGAIVGSAVVVEVEDTVGAGDAFMSALIAGLQRRDLLGASRREALRGLSEDALREILHEAATAAAITCSRPGADPPTDVELAVGLREWPVEPIG